MLRACPNGSELCERAFVCRLAYPKDTHSLLAGALDVNFKVSGRDVHIHIHLQCV